jgi:hypothetical protein
MMKEKFSKHIFFNGDSIREFLFIKLVDDKSPEMFYMIATKEEGYLTTMVPADNRWVIGDKKETALFCLSIETDLEQAIYEFESQVTTASNS